MELLGELIKGIRVPGPRRRQANSSDPAIPNAQGRYPERRHMHNRAARCMGCWDRCKRCKGQLIVRSRTTLWCPACKLLSPPVIVRVSRDARLRGLRSNCCNRRLRPANWIGWTDGRGTAEGQVAIRRAAHAKAQRVCGIVRCPNPHGDGRCGCSDPDGICEADHIDVSEF